MQEIFVDNVTTLLTTELFLIVVYYFLYAYFVLIFFLFGESLIHDFKPVCNLMLTMKSLLLVRVPSFMTQI